MSSIRRWGAGLVMVLAGCASLPGGAERKQTTTRGDLSEPEAVAHVLSRLTFGARPGDADRVRAMGIQQWIDAQLQPQTIPDSAVIAALAPVKVWTAPREQIAALANTAFTQVLRSATVPPPTMKNPDSLKNFLALRAVTLTSIVNSAGPYAVGKVIRAQESERQLEEVMADFWENHFSVFSSKMPGRDALVLYGREAIRPYSLGKFRTLLGAVAHSPAMMFYLDNHLSRSAALNENYARELMELHTLGVDGGYTQHDVVEVARALTGWTLTTPVRQVGVPAQPSREFVFNASMHDPGPKTVLGQQLPAGRGIEDGEQVLDIVARHPSTARYISTKLARRFVSDSPPPALIERATATFLRSDGDIAEVVRTIVTSPEFFSRAALRAKVKTPFELVVSTRRALAVPADTTIATSQLMTGFGQPMYGRQTPDGWPDVGTAWINSGALMKRILFGADVAESRLPAFAVERWPGWSAYKELSIEKQADGVISTLLGGIASRATRDAMLASTATGDARLREIVAIALGSPEFQRR